MIMSSDFKSNFMEVCSLRFAISIQNYLLMNQSQLGSPVEEQISFGEMGSFQNQPEIFGT